MGLRSWADGPDGESGQGGQVFELGAAGLRRAADPAAVWVELVWHGVNDRANLAELVASEIGWAEVDVRRDPRGRIVLHHDPFVDGFAPDTPLLLFADCAAALREAGRSVKLDFKDRGAVVRCLEVVDELGFDASTLWFNSTLDCLGVRGFARLFELYPGARMTCPVDGFAAHVLGAPGADGGMLARLRDCGINRLSLSWQTERFDDVFERLGGLGWDVNVYAVADLTEFVSAAVLEPRSITADFNFPAWGFAGRGSGAREHP